MKKVMIIYGLAEGSMLGRKLRKGLRNNGWKITKKVEEADAIIAHSGGIFNIPSNQDARIIIAVGMPLLLERPIIISILYKFSSDLRRAYRSLFLLSKTLLNIIYSIARPLHHVKIWNGYRKRKHREITATEFILVRNRDDIFSDSVQILHHGSHHGWSTVSLPGDHDDIWLNPDRYIKLLNVLYDSK